MLEDLFAKYGLPLLIIVCVFALVFFTFYSYLALSHLKSYGYVGDLCQKVSKIYIILSSVVIIGTIIALIMI